MNHLFTKEIEDIFLNNYFQFYEDTQQGKFGKTAVFWLQYVSLIHLYHDFVRSIRIGDLDLFIVFQR